MENVKLFIKRCHLLNQNNMKKLLLGIVIGAALASGVFYFINMYEENEQKAELKELLETAKQNQAINKQAKIGRASCRERVYSPV